MPRELLDRLYGYTDYARRRHAPYTPAVYDLGGMRRLLAALGNPEAGMAVVHLAGTKGKGSTATYLARLLTASGFRTGLTTSPQVRDERDRIAVNGRPIGWPDFERLFRLCETRAKAAGLRPTVFEFFTAMALLWFKEKKVHWAVVETGLGGRLDSTNVLAPKLTVLTPIGMDHMDKLGHTLALIAGEKAGILKAGVPAIVAPQRPAARAVIRRTAAQVGAPLIAVDEASLPKAWRHIAPAYQGINRAVALAAVKALGVALPTPAKIKACFETPIPGRYQKGGPFLLDGAHNPMAMEQLARSLKAEKVSFPGTALVIFCLADKDLAGMLRCFPKSMPRHYFDLDLPWARATRGANLKRLPRGLPILKTLGAIRDLARTHERVVITGSFSLVAHVLASKELGPYFK